MVVTSLPSQSPTMRPHERTAFPSTCTVQAPHCAMPQPNLVPVSLSSSRITQRRGVLSSEFAATGLPLRVNETIEASFGGGCSLNWIGPAIADCEIPLSLET